MAQGQGSVLALEDEAAFKKELQGALPGSVAVVLFHASFSPGNFGVQDLELLAADAQLCCFSVDVGEDDGEELALSQGLGSQLPVVRFFVPPSLAHVQEVMGPQCVPAAVSLFVAQLKKKASGEASGGIRDAVRLAYAQTAVGGPGVLPFDVGDIQKRRGLLGYAEGEVLESADLGLGCGNPMVTANLQPGEVVLDLGSGAGIDCFLAAKMVGPTGHVVGVDMTPEMLSKARNNARKDNITNVSFRLGEIEHLPVGDGVVDCLISNCVINLSPDKPQVYKEMNRVLAPGGRVSISDVLRMSDIPPELQNAQSYSCCVAGASAEDEMVKMLKDAGFTDIKIQVKENAADIIKDWIPGSGAEKYITSAYVTAKKPIALHGMRDDVRADSNEADIAVAASSNGAGAASCGPGACG